MSRGTGILNNLQFPNCLVLCAENDIDGEIFLTLTEDDLRTQFGIESLGFRRKVYQLVKVIFFFFILGKCSG